MRDVAGFEVGEGNLVQVQFANFYLIGRIHRIEKGGLVVPSNNPTQRGGVIPEKIYVLFEINLADAAPGANHPTLRRLPDPEKEIIVPFGRTETS